MLGRDGREITTGTAALGVETDFYVVTDVDGNPTSMVEEGLLRDWDAKGAAVHRRLIEEDFPLDDESRMHFGLWMGLQWLRGRAARQTGQELYDEINKLLITLGLDLPAGLADSYPGSRPPAGAGPGIPVRSLEHLPDEIKEILRDTDSYNFEPPKEHLVASMIKGVPEAAAPFIESQWFLVRASGPVLLTSDEPISLWREPTPQNELMGVGPVNAHVIQMPLSPERCLVMLRRSASPDVVAPVSDEPIAGINELTRRGWWSQLYRHPDGPVFPPLPPPLPPRR
ncbi:MAG TPA: DUF4238 domain-containing protein, partial [Solirubrobacteraceae bacterium]|nr:DUF4238 domain-containing protein [Solirubrobacteraceae bacterium]